MTQVVWEVTTRNFGNFLLGKPVAVLYFYADWYSAHPYMDARLGKLAEMFPITRFGRLDVDRDLNWGMTGILGIVHVPTVLFFVRGSRRNRLLDQRSIGDLARWVRTHEAEAGKQAALRARWSSRQLCEGL